VGNGRESRCCGTRHTRPSRPPGPIGPIGALAAALLLVMLAACALFAAPGCRGPDDVRSGDAAAGTPSPGGDEESLVAQWEELCRELRLPGPERQLTAEFTFSLDASDRFDFLAALVYVPDAADGGLTGYFVQSQAGDDLWTLAPGTGAPLVDTEALVPVIDVLEQLDALPSPRVLAERPSDATAAPGGAGYGTADGDSRSDAPVFYGIQSRHDDGLVIPTGTEQGGRWLTLDQGRIDPLGTAGRLWVGGRIATVYVHGPEIQAVGGPFHYLLPAQSGPSGAATPVLCIDLVPDWRWLDARCIDLDGDGQRHLVQLAGRSDEDTGQLTELSLFWDGPPEGFDDALSGQRHPKVPAVQSRAGISLQHPDIVNRGFGTGLRRGIKCARQADESPGVIQLQILWPGEAGRSLPGRRSTVRPVKGKRGCCLDDLRRQSVAEGAGDGQSTEVLRAHSLTSIEVCLDGGQVLPDTRNRDWFLVQGNRITPVNHNSALVVTGRLVVLSEFGSTKPCYLLLDFSSVPERLGMIRHFSPHLDAAQHLDLKRADFDGDEVLEFLYFVGLPLNDNPNKIGDLGVVLTPSPDGTGAPTALGLPAAGEVPLEDIDCWIADFTGDGLPELAASWNAGTGQAEFHLGVGRLTLHHMSNHCSPVGSTSSRGTSALPTSVTTGPESD